MKKISLVFLLLAIVAVFAACGHEHAFGDWVVVKEATCTQEGTRERVCECGEKETEAIPMIAHEYEEKVVSKKTCTEDGVIEKTCKFCGRKEQVVDKAEGHDFAPATVFVPKKCKVCGETEGKPLSKATKIGKEQSVDGKHSFIIESESFTGSLKEKRGNVTYSYQDKFVYAIKMTFKNLATENFERWHSDRFKDMQLLYKDDYKYEGEYWCPVDDIVPLGSDTVYLVFEVPEAMSTDTESAIYVTFTIDDTVYSFIKQKGKGADAAAETKTDTAAKTDNGNLKLGSEYTDGTNHSFVFKELNYTAKLSEKKGSTTYSFGTEGYYLALKLDLKNLQTENLEKFSSDRITDVKLTYDEQYNYEGDYWIPVDDIVPLGNGNVYIYFSVPKDVETSDGKLIANFTIDGTVYTVDCRAVA